MCGMLHYDSSEWMNSFFLVGDFLFYVCLSFLFAIHWSFVLKEIQLKFELKLPQFKIIKKKGAELKMGAKRGGYIERERREYSLLSSL